MFILLLLTNEVSTKTNNIIIPPSRQGGNPCLLVIFPEHGIDSAAYIDLGKLLFVAIFMH